MWRSEPKRGLFSHDTYQLCFEVLLILKRNGNMVALKALISERTEDVVEVHKHTFSWYEFIYMIYIQFQLLQMNHFSFTRICCTFYLYLPMSKSNVLVCVDPKVYAVWLCKGTRVHGVGENQFKHTRLHHCSDIGLLNLQRILCYGRSDNCCHTWNKPISP